LFPKLISLFVTKDRGGVAMKTKILALVVLSIVAGGCATTYHSAREFDGIYYTPRANRPDEPRHQANLPATTRDEPGVSQTDYREIPDNQQYYEYNEYYETEALNYPEAETYTARRWYYSESDYDFSYAARIRRFHRPNYRWAYFDPWFTNMYWYNHNPMYFGVSIYAGYGALGFFYPGFMFWNPTFYWYSWVTPFHWYSPAHFWSGSWAWHHWGPWWGHYGMLNPWSHAYWSGFHAGFHHGWWSNPLNYQYIYNSRDRNNYVYGHRGPTGSVIGGVARHGEARQATFAERFEASGRTGAPSSRRTDLNEAPRGERFSGRDRNVSQGQTAAPGSERGRERMPETGQPPREVRERAGEGTQTGPREQSGRFQTPDRTRPEDRRVVGERDSSPVREPASRTPQRTDPDTRPSVPVRTPEARPEQPVQRQPEPRPETPQREPEIRPVRPERTPDDYQAPSRSQYERQNIDRFERQNQAQRATQGQATNPEPNRPRTYTPPSHQQPRSTQEYTRPQTNRPQGTPRPESLQRPEPRSGSQPERSMTQPRPTQQTRPSGQERSQPAYSPPPRPRSTPTSAPVRTAPAPQRQPSGGSMSSPPANHQGSSSPRGSSERGRP